MKNLFYSCFNNFVIINITNSTTYLNEIKRSGIYQFVFYFNSKVMYVSAIFNDTDSCGSKYLHFSHDIEFLDEFNPDIVGEDYMLESIMEQCQIEDIGIWY